MTESKVSIPKWARYKVTQSTGMQCVFEHKPFIYQGGWCCTRGRYENVGYSLVDNQPSWTESIECLYTPN